MANWAGLFWAEEENVCITWRTFQPVAKSLALFKLVAGSKLQRQKAKQQQSQKHD